MKLPLGHGGQLASLTRSPNEPGRQGWQLPAPSPMVDANATHLGAGKGGGQMAATQQEHASQWNQSAPLMLASPPT